MAAVRAVLYTCTINCESRSSPVRSSVGTGGGSSEGMAATLFFLGGGFSSDALASTLRGFLGSRGTLESKERTGDIKT